MRVRSTEEFADALAKNKRFVLAQVCCATVPFGRCKKTDVLHVERNRRKEISAKNVQNNVDLCHMLHRHGHFAAKTSLLQHRLGHYCYQMRKEFTLVTKNQLTHKHFG